MLSYSVSYAALSCKKTKMKNSRDIASCMHVIFKIFTDVTTLPFADSVNVSSIFDGRWRHLFAADTSQVYGRFSVDTRPIIF